MSSGPNTSIPEPVKAGLMKLEDLRFKVVGLNEFRDELAKAGCLYVFDEYASLVSLYGKNASAKNVNDLAFWGLEIVHAIDSMVCGDYSAGLSVLRLYGEVYVDSIVKMFDRAIMLLKYDLISVENEAEYYEEAEKDEGMGNRE